MKTIWQWSVVIAAVGLFTGVAHAKFVTGQVVKVQPGNSVTIKDQAAQEHTIKLQDRTEVTGKIDRGKQIVAEVGNENQAQAIIVMGSYGTTESSYRAGRPPQMSLDQSPFEEIGAEPAT